MKKRCKNLRIALLCALFVLASACGGNDGGGLSEEVNTGDEACSPACEGRVCGDDGCGGSCGSCSGDDGNVCTDLACEEGQCVHLPNDKSCDGGKGSCYEGACCTPSCLTAEGGLKECGDNGCGGSCGECPTEAPFCATGLCVDECTADCSGKNCGDDGCGGSCGSCDMFDNSFCNADGLCDCQRACEGKSCGADGCGGTCGTCECGTVCQAGSCQETDDPCEGKECGSDGCGGSCGDCANGETCTVDGQCQGCEPKCAGKECGADGCGGTCGECGATESCQNGKCVAEPTEGTVGDACSKDADCTPPADAVCFTDMPGGYCAVPGCNSTADCPDGSTCVTLTGDGEESTWCLASCYGDSGCREGYFCHPDVGVCWYQPGGGDSEIGGPCSVDADCKDAGATCYQEMYGNEPTGFILGYCTLFDCSQNSCPSGSGCFSVGQDSNACLPTCTADSDCREGYACDGGICFPYCGNDSDCPGGYDCEMAEQFCIDEDVLCSNGNPMGWCPEGLYCQDGACGQFNFECTDNTLEPNESKAAAKTVTPSGFKQIVNSDMQVCVGDNDWFKVTVPAGKTGTLGIHFYHDVGDLDLCIYNASGQLLSCRYPFEDYPSTWRAYDWNDEFLSALAVGTSKTFYFKADGFYGAANDYNLFAWLTDWEDGAKCTDSFSFSECKGCKSNGQCIKNSFDAALMQFPHPDAADPYVGDGYVLEHASGYNWVRRETAMLIRHAIHEVQKKFPGTKPLGLMDMCQIDGITPGFDVGKPRHPETTHDEGGNIDVAYYQTIGDYSQGQVICDANGTSTDGYFCTSVANHVVDLPRTAFFLAKLAESDRFRVAGVDKLIAPLILDALEDLKNNGSISSTLYNKTVGSIAYGDGWPFHHHHIHLSLKWWSQRDHQHDMPIQCGFRMPGDGSWEEYIQMYK